MKQAKALILPIALIALACANQTAPTGGPKDEKPPVLVRSTPDSGQRNYQGNDIELVFNEMVQLANPKEEIIITPPVGKKTQFKIKDNRVAIEPENPLKENTTYTINFREGIKDMTEGNVPEGLYLAFSTGPFLDSLIIAGSVKSALEETIPEDITVAIYESDTFNIMDHTPDYFTKSDKTGAFRLTNLKPGTYRIYAFQDKNKNLKLDSQSEQFGFTAAPIPLTTNVSKISIALVNLDSRPLKLTSVRTQSTTNTIRVNKPLSTYKISSTVPILSTYSTTQSEVIAHYPDIHPDLAVDSTMVSFTAVDSVEQRIDTSFYIKRDGREKIEETFRVTTSAPVFNAENNRLEFTITFNKPLLAFNDDSLYIESDTATVVPLTTKTAGIDTIQNMLTFREELKLADSLIRPSLRLGKGFLRSIDGDSSKAESKTIDVLNIGNTGTLLVEIQTKQKNYIVQVLGTGDRVIAIAVNTPKPVFRYLTPGTYRVRVIVDENANGKWDTANYLQNKEPERAVYYLNSDKKTEIPLRANWEVGPNVIKL